MNVIETIRSTGLQAQFHTIFADWITREDLSWKAKGILIYLATRPEGWEIRLGDLARKAKDGKSAVRSGLQELAESSYWMELLVEAGIIAQTRLAGLQQEAKELTAILITCSKNAKGRTQKKE